MAITITFEGAADVYVPEEDFDDFGVSPLLIDGSGRLYSAPDENRRALRYTGSSEGVKIVSVILAAAGNTEGMLWGPSMLNSSGTGYAVRVSAGVVSLDRVVAMEGSGTLDTDDITMDLGGELELRWNPDTGSLQVYYEDVMYLSATDTTYDVEDGLTEAVYLFSWTSTAQGITSMTVTEGGDPPPDINPIVRISLKDRNLGIPEDDTGYSVVLRESVTSTAILYQTASGAIVDGDIVIDDDAVGDVDDNIHATVYKAGATRADDLNASGYVTVIDGNEEI